MKSMYWSLCVGLAMTSLSSAQETARLSPRQQGIVRVAAFTAKGDMAHLKPALHQALDAGLTVNEIKEVLIQMYAYAGFPRSLNGISAFMEVLQAREAEGIHDSPGEEPQALPADVAKGEYGEAIRTQLAGAPTRAAFQTFAPGIETFLKEHLFADIFARGVLSHPDRELATISALSALDGVEPQLRAHIAIGKNTGLTEEQIAEIAPLIARSGPPAFVFARGEPNPYGRFFTGQTYLTMLSTNEPLFQAPIGNVTFEPGARTFWHKHSGGQILLVTAGEGRYQARGEEIRVLQKGDVVHIAPDVEHWHGASPESWFSHIAVEPNAANNNQTTWLEAVTGADYP